MLSKTILSSDFIISAGQSKYDAIYDYKETGNYSLVPYQVNQFLKTLKIQLIKIFYIQKLIEILKINHL